MKRAAAAGLERMALGCRGSGVPCFRRPWGPPPCPPPAAGEGWEGGDGEGGESIAPVDAPAHSIRGLIERYLVFSMTGG